jgi:hypothetical protein
VVSGVYDVMVLLEIWGAADVYEFTCDEVQVFDFLIAESQWQ